MDPLGRLRRLMTRLGFRHGLPLREGNMAALVEGAAWLEATEAMIQGAQREVCFEMYIWEDDPVGHRVLGWLRDAAERGIRVRGLVDAIGSFGADDLISGLRDAGGEVLTFHPVAPWRPLRVLNQRNHRKLLLVDGEEALMGSANWSLDYDPANNADAFFDLGLALRGPSVPDLVTDFERLWRRCGGVLPAPLPYLPGTPSARWKASWVGPGTIQVVTAVTLRGRRALRRQIELFVQQANGELWIANAYFVPGARLLRLLVRTAKRGVAVRLLLAGRTDQRFVQAAGRYTHGGLLRGGAVILECPDRFLHAKAAVVDGHWALLGSANLDSRSFRHNLELNLALDHPAIVQRLTELFESEAQKGRPVDLATWEARPWWERMWQEMAYAFRWWL